MLTVPLKNYLWQWNKGDTYLNFEAQEKKLYYSNMDLSYTRTFSFKIILSSEVQDPN